MIVERIKSVFGLKMGCGPHSKHARPFENPSKNKDRSKNKQQRRSSFEVITVQKYDEIIVNVLYKDLQETPEMFVLNNILMNVQFFENYYRDIQRVSHTEGIRIDNELNKVLLKEECMECVSPDIILDKMNKNVRFKPHHGPKKLFSEGMVVKRLYVVNDHIDVINTMENIPQYTSIDKPAYQVRIEESGKKGFVRLKFIDSNKIPKFFGSVEQLQSYTSPASRDSDSDYTSITELRTPKPLEIVQGINHRRDSLPKSYFAQRKVRRRLSQSNLEGVYVNPDDETLYEKVTYLDANAFMSDFEKTLFPNSLGESLGFDETEISRAKSIPGKVFCNMIDEDDPDSFIPCEVIPAVSIEWPAEQAFEFQLREDRPTITDKRTGLQYRWPTDDMIQEIKTMTCVLVPSGYHNKHGAKTSVNSNLEWEIAFPKAERYIESRMNHTQLRCMLFLLAIHKTYIEPATHQNGLLVEHIRCHMYWECERDYRDWPEHRLGMKLRQVISNLNKKLSKGEMPDYFIKAKNCFENIPKKYLHFAQKILHDVHQAPVMHFIRALRNIQYPTDRFGNNSPKLTDFYTSLDWKELHKILINKVGLDMLNPKSKDLLTLRQRKYADRDAQWEHLYQLKKKQERLKKKQAEKNAKDDEFRKLSVDSINVEWMCEKEFDIVKSKSILTLFIENFIKMAEIASKISTKDQAMFHLKQAWYLTRILDMISPAFGEESMEYRETIRNLETAVKKYFVTKRDSDDSPVPPQTPARNSMQFEFSVVDHALKQRPVSGVLASPAVKSPSRASRFKKNISFIDPET